MKNKIASIILIMILACLATACTNSVDHDTSQKSVDQEELKSTKESNSNIGGIEDNSESEQEHILIAYFSLSDIVPDGADAVSSATPSVGNTEVAAMEIQKQVGGDLFAIRTENEYPVSHSEASNIAEDELKSDERPVLTTHIENMEQYDTVYLGYPIWWYVEPMAIRTFLEEYDFTGKTVIPFCTSLGARIDESEKNIKKMLPDVNVLSGITLRTQKEDFSEEITSWLSDIGMTE